MVNNRNIFKKKENQYEILSILYSEREPITSSDLSKKVEHMKRTAFFSNLRDLVKNELISKGYRGRDTVYSLTSKGANYYLKDPWRLISQLLLFKTDDFGEHKNLGYENLPLGYAFYMYESEVKSTLNGLNIRNSIEDFIYKEIKKAITARTLPEINPESKLILALEVDYNKMYEMIKKLRAFKEDLNSGVSLIFRDERLGFYKKDKKGYNLEILNALLANITQCFGRDILEKIDKLHNYIADHKDEFLSFIGEAIDKDLLNKVISDINDNVDPLDDNEIKYKLIIIRGYNEYSYKIIEGIKIYLLVSRYILYKDKEALDRIEKFEKRADKLTDAILEEIRRIRKKSINADTNTK